MEEPSRPPFGPKIYEAIERRQNKVHDKYWTKLCSLCISLMDSVNFGELRPPRSREPVKVIRILGEYARELFIVEARHYPKQDKRLVIWLWALARRVESDIIDKTNALKARSLHGLEYHTTLLSIRESIKPAIEPIIRERSGNANNSPVVQPLVVVEQQTANNMSIHLDDAALYEDISHEEQASRIGISRTAYFEVKAGRGGRKSRRKTEIYLSRVLNKIRAKSGLNQD